MTMMFMVPKKYNKDMLPKPNLSGIEFKEEPAKTVAAIRFSGWANDIKIEEYKQNLKAALDAEGINYSNKFYFLGYNAPFEVFIVLIKVCVTVAQSISSISFTSFVRLFRNSTFFIKPRRISSFL